MAVILPGLVAEVSVGIRRKAHDPWRRCGVSIAQSCDRCVHRSALVEHTNGEARVGSHTSTTATRRGFSISQSSDGGTVCIDRRWLITRLTKREWVLALQPWRRGAA